MNAQDIMESELRDHVPSMSAREQSAQIVQIDTGKHAVSMTLCAVISGICTAMVLAMGLHVIQLQEQHRQYESETQYRVRVLQNHVDELQARVLIANNTMERLQNESARR